MHPHGCIQRSRGERESTDAPPNGVNEEGRWARSRRSMLRSRTMTNNIINGTLMSTVRISRPRIP